MPLEEVYLGFETSGGYSLQFLCSSVASVHSDAMHAHVHVVLSRYLYVQCNVNYIPDYITAEAAKSLRLLHVKELRELQNSVNQAIVTVQALTANPKTDTKLGKVGKG